MMVPVGALSFRATEGRTLVVREPFRAGDVLLMTVNAPVLSAGEP